MAAFKRLLSHGHRLSNPPPPRHLVSLLRRHFSSDPQPTPPPESSPRPTTNSRNPIPIQPVSYPTKPKTPPPEVSQSEHPPERQFYQSDARDEMRSSNNENPNSSEREMPNVETRSWSPDDMRYMKNELPFNPASFAARVAPLPDDRANAGGVEQGVRDGEMGEEMRRIEGYRRMGGGSWFGRTDVVREEEVSLPFPQLIKVEKAEKKSEAEEKGKTEEKGRVVYDVKEAIRLVKANARTTFEETLEAHVRMTRDLVRTDLISKNNLIHQLANSKDLSLSLRSHRRAEQKLDGSVRLPHGAGKTYRVAVFAEGASADEAREAGADVVGGPELVESIIAGKTKIDFDKCVATPAMIKHVKRISKYLKKLMPETKKGNLTNDIARAVKDAKERVPFEKDKTAIVHVPLGKVKFADNSLKENIGAFVHALLLAKPAGLKKSSKFAGYVDTFHITSTMGKSYPVSIQSLSMAADQFSKMRVK